MGNEIDLNLRSACCFAGLLVGLGHGLLSRNFRCRLHGVSSVAELFDLHLAQMLDADESIMRGTRPYQFVEFYLQCRTVAILSVLNQEHHEERNNGRARIDDELPRIRIMKQRSAYRPDHDEEA